MRQVDEAFPGGIDDRRIKVGEEFFPVRAETEAQFSRRSTAGLVVDECMSLIVGIESLNRARGLGKSVRAVGSARWKRADIDACLAPCDSAAMRLRRAAVAPRCGAWNCIGRPRWHCVKAGRAALRRGTGDPSRRRSMFTSGTSTTSAQSWRRSHRVRKQSGGACAMIGRAGKQVRNRSRRKYRVVLDLREAAAESVRQDQQSRERRSVATSSSSDTWSCRCHGRTRRPSRTTRQGVPEKIVISYSGDSLMICRNLLIASRFDSLRFPRNAVRTVA